MGLESRLFIIVLLLSGLLLPSYAVTIQPGKYKMEWNTSEDISKTISQFLVIDAAGSDKHTISGIKSSRYLFSEPYELDYFRLIVDESKGTGKGYDVAYISLISNGELLDVRQATKVQLVKSGKTLKSGPFTMDVPYGASKTIRKTTLSIVIDLDDLFGSGILSYFTTIRFWSGWSGSIKTDGEDLKVVLDDQNADGKFERDRFLPKPDTDFPGWGDFIWIGRHNGECECVDCELLMLGGVSSYCNNLYFISVNPSGEEIDIKHYTGPSGKIKLNAVDGYNKLTPCMASITGKEGSFDLESGKEMLIPVGVYKTSSIFSVRPGGNENNLSVRQKANLEIKIQPEELVVINAGGPVALFINPEKDTITAKPGEEIKVALETRLKDEKVVIFGEKDPFVSIYGPDGKQLKSGKAKFG